MKQRLFAAIFAALLLSSAGIAGAQGNYEEDQNHENDNSGERFALGIGAGIVEPDGEGEIYYTANFRIRVGRDDEGRAEDEEFVNADGEYRRDRAVGQDRRRDWRKSESGEGIRAYIEPEIGYWKQSMDFGSQSDLNIGLNGIGVVPGRSVDYFFGVGIGLHFLDTSIDTGSPTIPSLSTSDSETRLGANFQVGLDLNMTDNVAFFGTGRFDVLDGGDDQFQAKVYVGLRFGF